MSGFRFRAQAALDLRRREDDQALAAQAQAEASLRAAKAVLQEAEQRLADARTRWAILVQQPGGAAQQLWYRSWIVRLDRERAASVSAVAARQKEQARAAEARARTNQRAKALERFREKSALTWERRVAAEEQKDLDALATMRFVTQRRGAQVVPERQSAAGAQTSTIRDLGFGIRDSST